MNKKQQFKISDILQIPLALISFVLFYIVKTLMLGFVSSMNNRKKDKLSPWRVVSSEMIKKPMVLTVFMTKAPRWNPHAIIGVVGPLKVESSIDIDSSQASRSASNWGMVMKSLKDGSEKKLSSGTPGQDNERKTLELKNGYYTGTLRYYGLSENISFPEIKIDGVEKISSLVVDGETNKFYKSLIQRKNLFYLALNYYVYTMLRFSRWLPESFVVKQYLPAADSDMEFKFGAIEKNDVLEISLEQNVLSNYSVYLALYDRASFPVQWYQIDANTKKSFLAEETGFYLFRFVLKSEGEKVSINENAIVQTLYK